MAERIWSTEPVPEDFEDLEQPEGTIWAVFETSPYPGREDKLVGGKPYGDRPYEIQLDSDSDYEPNDDDMTAWRKALEQAEAGDPIACRALEFLKVHSRPEYDAMMQFHAEIQKEN